VRAVLTERGLIKDKRAMPFVQLFKVRKRSNPPSFLSPFLALFTLVRSFSDGGRVYT
jgi:hypothetical protein